MPRAPLPRHRQAGGGTPGLPNRCERTQPLVVLRVHMSSDPEKPRACGATLRVEQAKRADRLHERLGREIRHLLRLTTAPRKERRYTGHIRAVHNLKLSDGPLRGTLTRPQKRTRRARNTHIQYLVKSPVHVTSPALHPGVIPEHCSRSLSSLPRRCENSCMSLVLGVTKHAGIRFAEVGFVLILIAGGLARRSRVRRAGKVGRFPESRRRHCTGNQRCASNHRHALGPLRLDRAREQECPQRLR